MLPTLTGLSIHLVPLLGMGFFTIMMAAGYYYNLTFIQLGLVDLGERLIGLDRTQVAWDMAFLALLTCLIAVGVGIWMSRRQIGFVTRLRIAFGVVLVQTALTPVAAGLESQAGFLAWILVCSLALGAGVPATFSLAADLVPVRWRGLTASLITSLAYLAANLLPASWTIQEFTRPLLWVMPAGAMGLGFVAFVPNPFTRSLAAQSKLPRFGQGRYSGSASRRLLPLIGLMFGVFFIDSLGFLRLLDTPRFMESAWQAEALNTRLLIGIVHAVAALVGGILYDALDVREMFYWIFGIFALTHLMYTFSVRLSGESAPLMGPILYATAVSLYTVVNFALWADLSTPQTIGRNVAVGVAVSGWTATFLSTALAMGWESGGMSLESHLNIVDSLAFMFLLAMLVQAWFFSRSGSSLGESV